MSFDRRVSLKHELKVEVDAAAVQYRQAVQKYRASLEPQTADNQATRMALFDEHRACARYLEAVRALVHSHKHAFSRDELEMYVRRWPRWRN